MTTIINTAAGSGQYIFKAGERYSVMFSKNLSGFSITDGKSPVAEQFKNVGRLGPGFRKFLDGCFAGLTVESVDFQSFCGEGEMTVSTGERVFADCANLKDFFVSTRQADFGEKMFDGCKVLSCVEPADYKVVGTRKKTYSVKSVRANFLRGCDGLKYIVFPESIDDAGMLSPAALNGSSVVKIAFPGISGSEKIEHAAKTIEETDCFGLFADCEVVFGTGGGAKCYMYRRSDDVCVERENFKAGYGPYAVEPGISPSTGQIARYSPELVEKCNADKVGYCVLVVDNCRSAGGMKFVKDVLENDGESICDGGKIVFFLLDSGSKDVEHMSKNVSDVYGKDGPLAVFKYGEDVAVFPLANVGMDSMKKLIDEQYDKMSKAGWNPQAYSEQTYKPDLEADFDDGTPAFVLCALQTTNMKTDTGDLNELPKMYYEIDVFKHLIEQKWPGGINKNNITCLSDNTQRIRAGEEIKYDKNAFKAAIEKYKNAKKLVIFYSDHGGIGTLYGSFKRKMLWDAIKDRSVKDKDGNETAQTFVMICACYARSMLGDPAKEKSAAPILFWAGAPADEMGRARGNQHGKYSPEKHHAVDLMIAFVKEFDPKKTYAQIWNTFDNHIIEYGPKNNSKLYGGQRKAVFGDFDENKLIFD